MNNNNLFYDRKQQWLQIYLRLQNICFLSEKLPVLLIILLLNCFRVRAQETQFSSLRNSTCKVVLLLDMNCSLFPDNITDFR